jgi:hypothetical protein
MEHSLDQPMDGMVQVCDLKIALSDFCAIWECSRLNSQKACTCCPVMKDINDMVYEQQLQPVSWLPQHSIDK